MSELLALLLGAGLIVGLALPLVTLVVKAALVVRWRHDPGPRRQGSLTTFLLLVAPSLGAPLWFISAALHLSEPGRALGICTHDAAAPVCVHTLLLAALLAAMVTASVMSVLRREAARLGRRASPLPADHGSSVRLRRLVEAHPRLRGLRRQIVAVDTGAHPICTRGLLRPVIEVAPRLLDELGDGALTAALLHEAEHHGARDPLRYLVASASLGLNPCGFLLRRELGRWRAAREAVCDELAVRRSADPLALAEALVAVARPARPAGALAAGLGDSSGFLRLRVHLLLDYASRPPGRASSLSTLLAVAALLGVIALPHVVGAWPLDLVHEVLDHGLASLLRLI